MAKPKQISIANEIDEVAAALGAARLLADELHHEQLGTVDDTRVASRAIAAVVNLAIARMALLTRALRGSVNPRLISETYNRALGMETGDNEVTLVEWNSKHRPTST